MSDAKILREAVNTLLSDEKKEFDEKEEFLEYFGAVIQIQFILEKNPEAVTSEMMESLLRHVQKSGKSAPYAALSLTVIVEFRPDLIPRGSKSEKSKKNRREQLNSSSIACKIVTTSGLLAYVNEIFDSLQEEFQGLSVGSQSAIKGMLLWAAFQDTNSQIPEKVLHMIKRRVIPAFKVIEAMIRKYPTMRMVQIDPKFDPTNYDDLIRGLSRIALANFLKDTPVLQAVGTSKHDFRSDFALASKTESYRLEVNPTAYPIHLLQLKQWERMGLLLEGGTYRIKLRGVDSADAVFLFFTTWFLSLPVLFMENITKLYRGVNWEEGEGTGRIGIYMDSAIDPWTGKKSKEYLSMALKREISFSQFLIALAHVSDEAVAILTEATQDIEFNEKLWDNPLRFLQWLLWRGVYARGLDIVRYYPYDLKNLFVMAIGAAYVRRRMGPLGAKDEKDIVRDFNHLRKLVIDLLNKHMGAEMEEELFPKALKRVRQPTVYIENLQRLLSRVIERYDNHSDQHLEFQMKIDEAVNQLYETIFPAEFEGKIIQLVLEEKWEDLYRFLVNDVIFGGSEDSEDLRQRAVDLLKSGKYPESDKIVQAFCGQ